MFAAPPTVTALVKLVAGSTAPVPVTDSNPADRRIRFVFQVANVRMEIDLLLSATNRRLSPIGPNAIERCLSFFCYSSRQLYISELGSIALAVPQRPLKELL